MTDNLSTYLEDKIWKNLFNGVPYTAPATMYMALYTSDPTDEDVGTEVSGGGYERQTFTPTTSTQAGGRATVYNSGNIEFPEASTDWGTITHAGLRDALTGGNLLIHGPIANPKEILKNDTIRLLSEEASFSLG